MRILGYIGFGLALSTFSTVGAAQPQPPPAEAANHFDVTGGAVHVVYTTAGTNGQPSLSYRDATQNLTFSGAQIQSVSTEMGTVVTVAIRRTIDTGSTTFSLLLPRVQVAKGTPASVVLHGVTTIHKFSVIAAMNRGQLDVQSVVEFKGTAAFNVI